MRTNLRLAFDQQIYKRQGIGGISRYFSELHTSLSADPDINIVKPEQADILHATFYGGSPKKRQGQKLVSSLFDMIPERLPGFFPLSSIRDRLGMGPHANKATWLHASDRIISISHASADELDFFNPGLSSRIRVIHLASSIIQQSKEPVLAMQGRRFWLMVGKRSAYKNGLALFMAVSKIKMKKEPPILFAAGGGDWSKQERQWIEQHQLHRFLNQSSVTDSQLAWLYQHAEAVCVPSMAEGFSLPLIEALQADTPVIASDIQVHREVAGAYATLISPCSTAAWTEVLDAATSQPLPSPSRVMGTEDWHRLVTYYGPERLAEEHRQTYQSLMA